MMERKAVTREVKARYKRSSKKEKGVILDEFRSLTGYNRSYAARALRAPAADKKERRKRKRERKYGSEVLGPLKKIWATMDFICGKRLKPFMGEIVERLEKFGEIAVTDEIKAKLLAVSPATIDRLLAGERKKVELKGRSRTKPGSLLKSQIPIRTFADWNETRPGFVEMDLVGHEGGNPRGEFAQTLDVTDVCSGWTETRAVKNKAQKRVFAALKDIESSLPFPLLGIDSDSGSEFINNQLFRYCQAEEITFTRSRVGRKNDSCYVEEKNYSVVRRNVGYLRYDTDEEVAVLNELYAHLRLYTNFFLPVMKLIEKTRTGSKVTKKYDEAKTPCQRLLLSNLPAEAKKKLQAQYEMLNPAELKRSILKLQKRLLNLCCLKEEIRRKGVLTAEDFEYISDEATDPQLEYIFT